MKSDTRTCTRTAVCKHHPFRQSTGGTMPFYIFCGGQFSQAPARSVSKVWTGRSGRDGAATLRETVGKSRDILLFPPQDFPTFPAADFCSHLSRSSATWPAPVLLFSHPTACLLAAHPMADLSTACFFCPESCCLPTVHSLTHHPMTDIVRTMIFPHLSRLR